MLNLIAVLLAVTAGNCPAELSQLAWLAGSWSGQDGKTEMEEIWTPPKGGVMLGLHRDVTGGKLAGFEFLRIESAAGGLVYQAQPQGRPATPFRCVEVTENRVVFENREHDFPKRIVYWLGPDGELHARVEGEPGGKTEAMEWSWRKTAR